MKKENRQEKCDSWLYFGLSYASWLVIPRIALQSMPLKWQHKFFALVEELFESIEFPEGYHDLSFVVTAKKNNKFVRHILPHYKHNDLPLLKQLRGGKE